MVLPLESAGVAQKSVASSIAVCPEIETLGVLGASPCSRAIAVRSAPVGRIFGFGRRPLRSGFVFPVSVIVKPGSGIWVYVCPASSFRFDTSKIGLAKARIPVLDITMKASSILLVSLFTHPGRHFTAGPYV